MKKGVKKTSDIIKLHVNDGLNLFTYLHVLLYLYTKATGEKKISKMLVINDTEETSFFLVLMDNIKIQYNSLHLFLKDLKFKVKQHNCLTFKTQIIIPF